MNSRFYENRILPYLLNVFMDTKGTREERRRSLAGVNGAVLEVSFGSGLNLPYYPETVTKVVGVDPSQTSAHLARKAHRRIIISCRVCRSVGRNATGSGGKLRLGRQHIHAVHDSQRIRRACRDAARLET